MIRVIDVQVAEGDNWSIMVSGTPVIRPKGQFRDSKNGGEVIFAPIRELDYELEVACIIGMPNKLGTAVPIAEADEHIFGMVLMNDWSGKRSYQTHQKWI